MYMYNTDDDTACVTFESDPSLVCRITPLARSIHHRSWCACAHTYRFRNIIFVRNQTPPFVSQIFNIVFLDTDFVGFVSIDVPIDRQVQYKFRVHNARNKHV